MIRLNLLKYANKEQKNAKNQKSSIFISFVVIFPIVLVVG